MDSDVVGFLKARLDEDERVARECAALFPEPWDIADRGWRVRIYAGDVPTPNLMVDDEDAMTTRNPVVLEVEPDRHIEDPEWLSTRIEHIVRQGPARTLREVEAKRRLLAMFPDPADGDGWNEAGAQVLEVLATAYDTHPDYDEMWRL